MLVGAGVGAATSLATGQSPWKGALMGAATGGIGSGLTSAGTALTPALTSTELATAGLANIPAATAPSILGGEMLGSAMQTGMSQAGAISSGAFNPGLLSEASKATANAVPGMFETSKRALGETLTNAGNTYNDGLAKADDFLGISEGYENLDFGDKLTLGKMGMDSMPQEEQINPDPASGLQLPKPQYNPPTNPAYLNTKVPNYKQGNDLTMQSSNDKILEFENYKRKFNGGLL